MNQKSLDKKKGFTMNADQSKPLVDEPAYKNFLKKTKELDCIYKPRWSGKQEYYKNLEQFHCKNGKTLNGEDIYVMTKSDVDNFLTQQRTELLEEIKRKFPDIDNSDKKWISKQLYDAKEIHKFLKELL